MSEDKNGRNEIVPVGELVPVPAQSANSMVTRGLQVIRAESHDLSLSDVALREACEEAFEREEYERAFDLLCALDLRGSHFVDELADMFELSCAASCIRYEGEEYDDDKRAERLLECLNDSAGRGNSLAQDILVSHHCHGSWADAYDPERDDPVAKLAIEAAKMGRRNSQRNLAIMYYDGKKGLAQDFDAAFAWFMRIAVNGDTYGQLQIGDMYRKGEGVQKSVHEAIRWFEKVAAVDDDEPLNRDAAFRLSDVYFRGETGMPEYGRAYQWVQIGLAPNLKLVDKDMQWLAKLRQRLDSTEINSIDRVVGEWVRDHRKNTTHGGWICLPEENTATS